jgi:prepilin-type N-terminal cleavage/methylation domain-containing protein
MKKAFTLIELAFVLAIIGILLGSGIGIFTLITKRAKIKESENIVKENIEILKNYASIHKKVPNSSEFISIINKKEDIWGKKLGYKYAKNLTDNNSICYENSTPISITICENKDCSKKEETINNIAFLIFSSGENQNAQTNLRYNNVKIYLKGIKVDKNLTDFKREDPYDDIIVWVKLNELKNIANCEDDMIHILNRTLPDGNVNESYKATIYAEGGLKDTQVGDYQWCYEGSLPNGLETDPKYHSDDCLKNTKTWRKADVFKIEGTPTEVGTFKITVYAKDENSNIAKKSFAFSINPK